MTSMESEEFIAAMSADELAKAGTMEKNYAADDEKKNNMPGLNVVREKTIGFGGATGLIIGCIIGSGIFVSTKETLAVTPQSSGLVLLYWVFGGITSLMGAFTYASLGVMIPVSGGERTYLCEALGSNFGTIFTYGIVFINKSISVTAIAMTFGKYIVQTVRENTVGNEVFEKLFAFLAIMVALTINIASTRLASRTQILFTILKSLAVVAIICAGVYRMIKDGVPSTKEYFKVTSFHPSKIGSMLSNVYWSYEGWNTVCFVAGEISNPKRNLPLSIGFGVGTVTILYVLTVAAYIQVLSYSTVSYTETVAVSFAEVMFTKVAWIIPAFIAISTYGTVNGYLLSVPRITMTAAVKKEIPGIFGLVHKTKRTPVISIISIVLISLIFLPFDFQALLQCCMFMSWFFYALTAIAYIKLRFTRKDLDRSFLVPLVFPVTIILIGTFMFGFVFYSTPIGSSIIFLFLVLVFILLSIKKISAPKFLVRLHDKIVHFFEVTYDLVPADEGDIS